MRTVDGGSWTALEELAALITDGISIREVGAALCDVTDFGIGEATFWEAAVREADDTSMGELTILEAEIGPREMALRSALRGLKTGLPITSSLMGLNPDI